MVVVMTAEAGETEVDGVVDRVRAAGGDAFVSRGMSRTIVGLVGDVDHLDTLTLRGMPGVSDVVRISSPYKLVSREHHRERSVIRVAGVPIGPDTLTVIAGPCAVETAEQTMAAALMARAAGASLLRGGAYKPRSSPYAFQGLGEAGLKILAEVREATGLPVGTEAVAPGGGDRERGGRGRHHRGRAPVPGARALRRPAGGGRVRPAGAGRRGRSPAPAGRPPAAPGALRSARARRSLSAQQPWPVRLEGF